MSIPLRGEWVTVEAFDRSSNCAALTLFLPCVLAQLDTYHLHELRYAAACRCIFRYSRDIRVGIVIHAHCAWISHLRLLPVHWRGVSVNVGAVRLLVTLQRA